jgi:hypothetical protein
VLSHVDAHLTLVFKLFLLLFLEPFLLQSYKLFTGETLLVVFICILNISRLLLCFRKERIAIFIIKGVLLSIIFVSI